MSSALVCDRDTVLAAVSGLEAAVDTLGGVSFDGLTNPEVVAVLARVEAVNRRRPVIEHRLIGTMLRDGSARDLGAKNFADMLSTALRISGTDAKRRLTEAADLGERTALTGEPLPPLLPHVAAQQAAGRCVSSSDLAPGAARILVPPRLAHRSCSPRSDGSLPRLGGICRPSRGRHVHAP